MSDDKYSDEELMYFDKKANELILWLFDTKDKRYAIVKTLKDVYKKRFG